MYIFKGDEMYNDEFLAALDNSPTYLRTAQDLERITSILGNETAAVTPETADAVPAEEIKNNIVEEENNDDDDNENVGRPVFYNE